jgi:2-polyprenyl-6-methoxyphenol hydroxylase-like FAD-dependent oxidoreductase
MRFEDHTELIRELSRAGRRYTRALERYDREVEARDEAIIRASEAGLSYRKIAPAIGLHFNRVQKIVQGARKKRVRDARDG